jgi:hypothetical protein
MERHGAVVTGPDGNAFPIQHSRYIMSVNITQGEGNGTSPVVRGLGTVDPNALDLIQSLQGIGDQLDFVLADLSHP